MTRAFRARGHTAYSCDVQPTRGEPSWHLQEDVMKVLPLRQWDLAILHPDCTAMAVSGNAHYAEGTPGFPKRRLALGWTIQLWELAKQCADRVALENPVSVIFNCIGPVQYIEPYWFGHGETKRTGLALHNLPSLEPTDVVKPWHCRVQELSPSATRKRDRAETYQGIATAMAEQWGDLDGLRSDAA